MTQPPDIHDDLQRILALAKRALTARDDAAAWSRAPEKQIEHHGACCDALWCNESVGDHGPDARERETNGNTTMTDKMATKHIHLTDKQLAKAARKIANSIDPLTPIRHAIIAAIYGAIVVAAMDYADVWICVGQCGNAQHGGR